MKLRELWVKLPKPLKKWLAAATGILALILVAGVFNPAYGLGLLFSFFHADFAIIYWLSIGAGTWAAIAIAIVIGGIGAYNIWWISEQDIPYLKKIFGVKNKSPASYPRWLVAIPYLVLLCTPMELYFGVTFGVVFSKTLRLRRRLSITLILIGNSAKMVLIGIGVSWITKTTSIYLLVAALILWIFFFLYHRKENK